MTALSEQLRIARLPRNSSNSSRPPSTDLYKPARDTYTSLRQKSGKKTGGQHGHAGSTLLFSTATPDAVIRHSAEFCEQCGNELSLVSADPEEVRQVVDIPEPRYCITNHITYKKVCTCGHCNHGSFPMNVKSQVSYGSGLEALVVNLSTRQYMPYGRLSTLISDQYGISMSEGTIANMLERFEVKARSVYDYIQSAIPKADVAGSDETSIKVNGRLDWFHTYQSSLHTFIGYHHSRGKQAQEQFYPAGLPKTILVSDCVAMQLSTSAARHQACLSHLQREIRAMEQEHPGQRWPIEVKRLFKQALKLKSQHYNTRQVEQIERQFQKLLGHVFFNSKVYQNSVEKDTTKDWAAPMNLFDRFS